MLRRRSGDLRDPTQLLVAVEDFLHFLGSSPAVYDFTPALVFNRSKQG